MLFLFFLSYFLDFFSCAYVYTLGDGACTYVHIYVEARDECWIPSWIIFHLIWGRDRVSCWTYNSLTQLECLAQRPQSFSYSTSLGVELQTYSCMPSLCTWILGDWTQVPVFVQLALTSLYYIFQTSFSNCFWNIQIHK